MKEEDQRVMEPLQVRKIQTGLSSSLVISSQLCNLIHSFISPHMYDIQIGDKGQVTWRDGKEKLKAIVIERRPADFWKRRKKRKLKSSSTTNVTGIGPDGKLGVHTNQEELVGLKYDEIDYYVHYEAHDR